MISRLRIQVFQKVRGLFHLEGKGLGAVAVNAVEVADYRVGVRRGGSVFPVGCAVAVGIRVERVGAQGAFLCIGKAVPVGIVRGIVGFRVERVYDPIRIGIGRSVLEKGQVQAHRGNRFILRDGLGI